MNRMLGRSAAAALVAALTGCSGTLQSFVEPARADASAGAESLRKLPRKQGERVAVTIYEFRSTLPGTSPQAATEMFKTALVQSGQFRVVERLRVAEGIAREKQLNAAGASTGASAQQRLRGAQYVFEGAVTGVNANEAQRGGGIGVAGMHVGSASNRDTIMIDVRIVDAANGDVVDAVTVRKSLKSDEASVSGVGSLVNTVLATKGRFLPYTPDVQARQQRAEGSDTALRAAIEEAVLQLARRFEP